MNERRPFSAKSMFVFVLVTMLCLSVTGCSSRNYENTASIAQVYESHPDAFDAAAQAALAFAETGIYVRDHLEPWETSEDYVIQEMGQLYFISRNTVEENDCLPLYNALVPVFENTDVSGVFPVSTPDKTWQIQFLLESSYGICAELYYTQASYEAPYVMQETVEKQQIGPNWAAVITSD